MARATPTAPVKDWQALARSTTTDVRGALQNEPGIAFGGGNGASQWTTIRGLGESNIDFDIDGTTSTSQIFHHQSRFMSDPALMKQIRVEKGTGAASAGIGVIGGAIRAETLDATDLLAEGQSAGARINGGISSKKGHNGGFAATCAKNFPSATTATHRATATASATPATSPIRGATSAPLATSTATFSTSTAGKNRKARRCG